jgi:hypothetical protein
VQREPADCEYLVDGRLCRAIAEQPEGRDVRKKFCKHRPKDYCCYLCADRENCVVSCDYLESPRESEFSFSNELSLKVEREIKKCEEEKAKLTGLFANGKIGEKSYLTATTSLDNRIEKLKKAKESHKLSEDIGANLPEGEEFEEAVTSKNSPSALWYLVPFFFGIIGGIVGYVGTKDEDRGMADGLLIFGIVWTVILAIVYFAIVASILSHF